MLRVEFRYLTGVRQAAFTRGRLRGSWNQDGAFSESWSEHAMELFIAEDGCRAFRAVVEFPESEIGRRFEWGVVVDTPERRDAWAIAAELHGGASARTIVEFTLGDAPASRQDYYLTLARRLGARKLFSGGGPPSVRFAVWAPHARSVEVVFADPSSPYVFASGEGVSAARPALSARPVGQGIWEAYLDEPFETLQGLPYMYKLVTEQGEVRYRTDIFSRRQAGQGRVRPDLAPWNGSVASLDGSTSCSVVAGHDDVAANPGSDFPRVSREEFWRDEFDPSRPVPKSVRELVIYELHVGGLGAGRSGAGTLRDAIDFVGYLADLGVNCVELMPINEFSGNAGWGYGQTHHFAFESSAGTLDDYRHFIRACHRHGIAVIQDVCYNHYDQEAERAQWQYDSTLPEHNSYYWYEGRSAEYASADGGFIDNGSSGFAPRYHELVVRQQFISSAALMLDDCHVDGFRVDLTQAFHRDNCLHQDGSSVASANLFGQKLLREWARTLSLLEPSVMLVAEDHTGWDRVTAPIDEGGLGFSARWDAAFYHHLIGDSESGSGKDRILHNVAHGGDSPIQLFGFASALYESQFARVVYHESHDEAGNAESSQRTLVHAVAGAPLIGDTRRYAEARARVAFALSLFSAATPLFFMGEEVGSTQRYTFDRFLEQRDDLYALRAGSGARMFSYYRDAIALRRTLPSLSHPALDVVHANPDGRVVAFVRHAGEHQSLVIASLSNGAYHDGYVIRTDHSRLGDGDWQEVFNSDAESYGGSNFGNEGARLRAREGRFEARLPACGIVVFQKTA